MASLKTDLESLKDFTVYPRNLVPTLGEKQSKNSFSIVTYNILQDGGINDGYTHLDKEHRYLSWRHPRIMKELEEFNTDIVCLQEVEKHHYDNKIKSDLAKLGYLSKHMPSVDGVVVAFKKETFELVSHKECILAEVVDGLLDKWQLDGDDKKAIHNEMHNYPQIMLLVKLKVLGSRKVFSLGNTHIKWGNLQRPDVQLLQVCGAVNALVEFAEDGDEAHVLCGDFNTPPVFPAYDFLKTRRVGQEKTDRLRTTTQMMKNGRFIYDIIGDNLTHNTIFKSAYSAVMDREPEATNIDVPLPGENDIFSECLDYFWFSSEKLEAIAVLDTPPMSVLRESNLLPNSKLPSDHIPLLTHLQFKD